MRDHRQGESSWSAGRRPDRDRKLSRRTCQLLLGHARRVGDGAPSGG